MTFTLYIRGTEDEPRWMGDHGSVTPFLMDAQRFEAVPSSRPEPYFLIDPPLPADVWDRWSPFFFSQRIVPDEGIQSSRASVAWCLFFVLSILMLLLSWVLR